MLSFDAKDFGGLYPVDEKTRQELHEIKIDLMKKLDGYSLNEVLTFFSKIILGDFLSCSRVDKDLVDRTRNYFVNSKSSATSTSYSSENTVK